MIFTLPLSYCSHRHYCFQFVQLHTVSHKNSAAQSRSFGSYINYWIPSNISGPLHNSDIVSSLLFVIFHSIIIKVFAKGKLQTPTL